MNKTLQYYNDAMKDVKLNSIPSRFPDKSYQWSDGQSEILNQQQFSELRIIISEIEQSTSHRETLKREMLVYQNPTNKLAKEGDTLTQTIQAEIDDEQVALKGLKAELSQYNEDMSNRGFFISEDDDTNISKPIEEKVKEKRFNLKTVFGFLGVWLIGEIFMTYVQWNALRDEKGIEDLVVRSLSFGVVLFLIHFVAHLNKKYNRNIYYIFLGFSLLMLLTMLFAPLAISKLYPIDGNAPSVADEWSITNGNSSTNISVKPEYPFWVQFYRSYEVTPAILCFIFFIGMQSFIQPKGKGLPNQEKETAPKSETAHDQIRRRRNHFLVKIRECETRINGLHSRQTEVLYPNTDNLNNILKRLETHKMEIIAIEKRIATQKTTFETRLTALENELNNYKTEYLDILRSDSLKFQFINPEWPVRNDILTHFKSRAI